MIKSIIASCVLIPLSVCVAGPGPTPHHGPKAPPPVTHHHDYDQTATIVTAIGMIGTVLLANEINKQKQQTKTIIVRSPKTNNRVVYWCESQKQFFPHVDSCSEGWQEINLP